MKSKTRAIEDAETIVSHLTRGAWIEIFVIKNTCRCHNSRTSHEVRGLKYCLLHYVMGGSLSRTSHEVRGLKSFKFQESGK